MPANRLPILKTYKLYIGGKFPRTESGRYYPLKDPGGALVANVCQGSRKDFRNAVVAARKATSPWSGATAYNRGQILYRAAEMLEGNAAQFAAHLQQTGTSAARARQDVGDAVDTLVHYAGWTDKFPQIFSSVNPVAGPFFNFSVPEPTGLVAVVAPEDGSLSGLVAAFAPVIAGGNACVVLASEKNPLPAVTLAEVLATSDLPGGVVNLLTGFRAELLPHIATHMDVNGIVYYGENADEMTVIQENAALNIRRVHTHSAPAIPGDPYRIMDFQETKTTWHPVGV